MKKSQLAEEKKSQYEGKKLIDVFQIEKKKILKAEKIKAYRLQAEAQTVANNLRERERKILQEKDLFKDKLSDIRDSIKNKSPQMRIELLEHFINEENTIVLDNLIGFLLDYTPLYSPRSIPQINKVEFRSGTVSIDSVQYNKAPIIEDIKAAGGIFQFYKSISKKLDSYRSLTDWQLGLGWMWLLAETTKLYDRAILEIKNTKSGSQNKTPQKPIPIKPLLIRMNWLATDEEPNQIMNKLKKGEILNYENIDNIYLIGTNIYFDALALWYVLADAGKIRIKNPFATLSKIFNIDRATLKTKNEELLNPLNNAGINKNENLDDFEDSFTSRVKKIKKILNY